MSESAAELRERFESSRRAANACSKIRELMREGKLAMAATVAESLGEPLPRQQIVRVDFTRPRA